MIKELKNNFLVSRFKNFATLCKEVNIWAALVHSEDTCLSKHNLLSLSAPRSLTLELQGICFPTTSNVASFGSCLLPKIIAFNFSHYMINFHLFTIEPLNSRQRAGLLQAFQLIKSVCCIRYCIIICAILHVSIHCKAIIYKYVEKKWTWYGSLRHSLGNGYPFTVFIANSYTLTAIFF